MNCSRMLVVAAIALAACSSDKKTSAGGSAASAKPAAAAGGAAAQGASKVQNPCAVMPADLVKKHIPDAAAPNQGPDPFHCSMSNGKSVVEISLSGGFGEPTPLDPAETIAGLGQKAWLQEQQADDAFLVVFLGQDDKGSYRTLSVEYGGHDGKKHKDDAIEIARQIISALN